jgi:ribosome-binding ATPase YchF (GTP1/OBG family)
MKLSKLRSIIAEEVKLRTKHNILSEGLVDKILSLILAPKIKRDADKLKKSAEYQALVSQAKQAIEGLEIVNNQLEQAYRRRDQLEKEAERYGIKLKPYSNTDELIAQFSSNKELKNKYGSKLKTKFK